MLNLNSAIEREETPLGTNSTQNNTLAANRCIAVGLQTTCRVCKKGPIPFDPQSRAVICYARREAICGWQNCCGEYRVKALVDTMDFWRIRR